MLWQHSPAVCAPLGRSGSVHLRGGHSCGGGIDLAQDASSWEAVQASGGIIHCKRVPVSLWGIYEGDILLGGCDSAPQGHVECDIGDDAGEQRNDSSFGCPDCSPWVHHCPQYTPAV